MRRSPFPLPRWLAATSIPRKRFLKACLSFLPPKRTLNNWDRARHSLSRRGGEVCVCGYQDYQSPPSRSKKAGAGPSWLNTESLQPPQGAKVPPREHLLPPRETIRSHCTIFYLANLVWKEYLFGSVSCGRNLNFKSLCRKANLVENWGGGRRVGGEISIQGRSEEAHSDEPPLKEELLQCKGYTLI